MNESRLLKEIDRKSNLQSDKYYKCIKEIIKSHPDYYINKTFAKKYLKDE